MTKRTMKQFLNDNQPDNILNYVDPTDIWSIEPGFKKWYEANPERAKSKVARFVYGIIIAVPKIERYCYNATFKFWQKVGVVRRYLRRYV